jgi:long-subunit fatty acid transport protein
MGYAFTGLADDATAISWNSAGLTQLQQMEASVVGRFGFGSASYDYPSGIGIDQWDVETQSNFQFNFASFIVPFSAGARNIVAGVAYRNVYDFSQYYKEMVSGDAAFNLLGYEEYISDDIGGVNAISPALAVQVTDIFSVGGAANILMGSYEFKESYDGFEEDPVSLDFSGVSFDIGALVQPSPMFSIGANFNLPHSLTWKMEGSELDMKIPFFWSLGAAFRATDVLTILFDYRNRSWSNTEAEVEGENIEEFFGFQDANSFHVGLEYLASAGDSFVPIRIGYNTVPQLLTDYYEESITAHNFTAGVGLILGKVILDAAFEFQRLSYVEYQYTSATLEEDVVFNQNNFRITIGGVLHLGD